MRLEEVFDKLPKLYNKPFSELKLEEDISGFSINKGNTGQFLQALLDMPNNSDLTDFDDGELKTNKTRIDGTPDQTMFITQISRDFDSLFFEDLESNRLLDKISNLLYLPVVKPVGSDPEDWYFLPAHHIDSRNNEVLKNLYLQDFLTIKEKVLDDLENSSDGFIHTANGKYIQIRSKDSMKKDGTYNPIYSQKLGREVSNKNHAFYFKRQFMLAVQSGEIPSNIIL
ncbi:hypothetical protein MN210_00825 [Psychrobacter raelei]|uniref:DNA mismatch repair protein MutH n=1 Tax=Psychrobacter raelei TaxID=2565531 RepID=A0AAT9PDU3_9GAMM|nr:hypothetical protein [Psychrobacter sp. PraFG1]UNK05507.1 hypothetical protein MN210_00825 [Psychrobacter sp. PraFG1]